MAYSFIILSFISPFSYYYYGLLGGWYHFTTAATVAKLLLSQSQYHGIRTDRFDLVKNDASPCTPDMRKKNASWDLRDQLKSLVPEHLIQGVIYFWRF